MTTRFCAMCGQSVDADARFCGECGSATVGPGLAAAPLSAPASLPAELAELADHHGDAVLADAESFRAALDDFLDERTASTGTINLLTDAVRYEVLNSLRTMLDAGADTAAAIEATGDRLARDRGSTTPPDARWAAAVLGFAVRLVPAELVDRFAAARDASTVAPVAPVLPAAGGFPMAGPPAASPPLAGPPLASPPLTGPPAPPLPVASVPQPPPAPPIRGRGRRTGSRMAVVLGAVLVLLVAAAVAAFTWAARTSPGGTGSEQAGAAASPSAAGGSTCTTVPTFAAVEVRSSADQLTVAVDAAPGCADGQWLTQSRLGAAVVADGTTYASGYFDLGTHPLWIPADGQRLELSYGFDGVFATTAELQDALGRDAVTMPVSVGSGSVDAAAPADTGAGTPDGAILARPTEGTVQLPEVPDLDGTAAAALRRIADADDALVTSTMADFWVPQLASGTTTGAPAGPVLENHLRLRASHADVVLIDSTGWASFERANYWVTAVAAPEPASAPVLYWCRDQGFSRGDCLAKRIRRYGASDGNTDLWPPDPA